LNSDKGFGLRGKVTGEWRKLHDEEPFALCTSQNRIRVIKSKRMQERQCTYNFEARSCYHGCSGKVRQYLLHIMMCVCSRACWIHKVPYCHLRSAVQYFSKLSYRVHEFRGEKKITDHKMCVFIFFTNLI